MAQLTCPHCQHAFSDGPSPPFWHDPSAIDSTGYTASRQPDRRPNANVPQVRPPTAPNARHYADGSKRAESQSPPNLTLTSRLHPPFRGCIHSLSILTLTHLLVFVFPGGTTTS